MRIKKTDRLGTIHELAIQLANISEMDNINPTGVKQKNEYKKLFEKYNLFPKSIDEKKKKEIINSLKLMNFNEAELQNEQDILRSVNSYNRLIDKKRREIEDEIRAGKNVKKNDLILKNVEKIEIVIPRGIRGHLKIYDKAVRLRKFSTIATKNRIKYYSGQDYNFLIKDGFSRPYYISYDKVQKIRREGNIIEFLLKNFEKSVNEVYEKDKKNLQADKKKWLAKQKVYNKILKVINHNMQIATNKKYNKKLVTRSNDGKISKDNSEYPVLMDILDEIIDLYIP